MADINSSDLTGGGGLLKTSAIVAGLQLNAGATADLTISCPSGKYLNLTALTGDSALGGITITVGGRTLISSTTIQRTNTAISTNSIKVGLVDLGSGNGITVTNSNVMGGKDEDIVFSFASATTARIRYAYEVLEDA